MPARRAFSLVELVVVLGWHDADTLWYETPAGTSWDGGVPGAASTMKVSVPPVSSTTVTVHVSAEAVGSAATALVTSTDANVTAPIFSLRLLDTLSQLLPHVQSDACRAAANRTD